MNINNNKENGNENENKTRGPRRSELQLAARVRPRACRLAPKIIIIHSGARLSCELSFLASQQMAPMQSAPQLDSFSGLSSVCEL